MRFWARDLLHFWFHELTPADWFRPASEVDEALRSRYEHWLTALSRRPAAEFLRDRRTARAAILLFDQVPRNLYRDSGKAFACDALAGEIVRGVLRRNWHRGLTLHENQFLFMPLMHSEKIADQRDSLRRFAALGDSFILGFARDHYRMIARFGRFPHRNAVLGRRSTAAEKRAIEAGNAW